MAYGKDKSTRIVYMALVASWIIIGVGIWYVFFKTNPHVANEETQPTTGEVLDTIAGEKRYYIDQGVILRGNIESMDQFGEYSHTFTDSDSNTFGLKSAITDLYEYTGEVSIKGTVVAFVNSIPVIQVDDIVSETLDEIQPALEASEGVRYIQEAGLLIDLSPTQGFGIEQSGEEIKIIDVSGASAEAVLSITSFGCDASSNLTDCETLYKNFQDMGADSFVSSRGVTYTNMTETNTWIAFDGQGRGYYMRPSGEKNLTTFVDLISFVNDATLSQDIQEEVLSTCKTLEAKIGNTYTLSSSVQGDGLLDILVTGGSDDQNYTLLCKYQATLGHTPRFKHISTVTEQNEEENKEEETLDKDAQEDDLEENEEGESDDTTLTGAIDGNTAKVIDEGEYAGQLSFSSTRGYTLYFSDKGIGYAGSYLEGNDVLRIGDTSCSYGVKITSRSNIDNIGTGADSIIYECTGDLQLEKLPAGITYIENVQNKHFLKKDITGTYAGMEVGIMDNADE